MRVFTPKLSVVPRYHQVPKEVLLSVLRDLAGNVPMKAGPTFRAARQSDNIRRIDNGRPVLEASELFRL